MAMLALVSCKYLCTRDKTSITPYLFLYPEEFVSWLIEDQSSLPPSLLLVFLLLDLFSVTGGGRGGGNACVMVGCHCLAISFLLLLYVEVSFCSVYLSRVV